MLKISKYSIFLLLALAGCTEQIDFENDVPQRAKAISQRQVDAMMSTMDATKARETYRVYTQSSAAKAQVARASKTLDQLKREKRKIEQQIAQLTASHRRAVCPTCNRAYGSGAKGVKPKTIRMNKSVPSHVHSVQTATVQTPQEQQEKKEAVIRTVQNIENVEEPVVRRRVARQSAEAPSYPNYISQSEAISQQVASVPQAGYPSKEAPDQSFIPVTYPPVQQVLPQPLPVQPGTVQQVLPQPLPVQPGAVQPIPQQVSIPSISGPQGMPYGGGSAFAPKN